MVVASKLPGPSLAWRELIAPFWSFGSTKIYHILCPVQRSYERFLTEFIGLYVRIADKYVVSKGRKRVKMASPQSWYPSMKMLHQCIFTIVMYTKYVASL
jgi:hypothetical protein